MCVCWCSLSFSRVINNAREREQGFLICFSPHFFLKTAPRTLVGAFIKETFLIYFLLHFPSCSLAGRVGCPHYIAPEVLTRRQYGKACDVWGAGVMLHVLLSGRLPFNGSGRRLQEAIARGRVTVGISNGFPLAAFDNREVCLLSRSSPEYKTNKFKFSMPFPEPSEKLFSIPLRLIYSPPHDRNRLIKSIVKPWKKFQFPRTRAFRRPNQFSLISDHDK